jgi:hypothetical protein
MSIAERAMQLLEALHRKLCLFELPQQGFHLFKVHPCTLWDEPHPPCWNPNDAQQHFRG